MFFGLNSDITEKSGYNYNKGKNSITMYKPTTNQINIHIQIKSFYHTK